MFGTHLLLFTSLVQSYTFSSPLQNYNLGQPFQDQGRGQDEDPTNLNELMMIDNLYYKIHNILDFILHRYLLEIIILEFQVQCKTKYHKCFCPIRQFFPFFTSV